MKHVIIALVFAACAPRSVTPVPSSENAGAFADPPARVMPREDGSEAVRGWVVLGRAQTTNLSQTHVVTTGEPFAQILVKAVDGEAEIEQIEITYRDHQSRVVRLGRRLVAGDGQVIELREKRPIEKIVVHTDPDSRGDYVLFGG